MKFWLILVSIGIGRAWVAHRLPGVIPMLAAWAYLGALAVARTSGGRYLLPVDWVVVMYFAIGAAQVVIWAHRLVWAKRPSACGAVVFTVALTPSASPEFRISGAMIDPSY